MSYPAHTQRPEQPHHQHQHQHQHQESDASPTSRSSHGLRHPAWRRTLVVIGGVGAVASALLVLGTFVPTAPVVGTLGSLIWPTIAAPGALLALVAAAMTAVAWHLGARRAGAVLTTLALVAAAGSAVLVGNQALMGHRNGVSTNVLAALISVSPGSATPDDTVEYDTFQGQPVTLDVYRPDAAPADGAPVVVYVHGGGWSGGTPAGGASTLRWYADQGYLAIGVGYTLSTKSLPTWDIAAGQVQCSLAWIAANASTYGGDVDRLAVYGESAGGQLVLAATYAAADDQASPSCEGDLPAVDAVMAEVPGVDMTSLYDNDDLLLGSGAKDFVSDYLGGTPQQHPDRVAAVSATNYAGPASPPTLVMLNLEDHLVPVEGAETFVAEASAAGVDITTLRRPWTDHTTSLAFNSVHTQVTRGATLDFFRSHGVQPQ